MSNALLLSDSKTIIETHCGHQRETTISLSDACAPPAAINDYYVLSLAILASHPSGQLSQLRSQVVIVGTNT